MKIDYEVSATPNEIGEKQYLMYLGNVLIGYVFEHKSGLFYANTGLLYHLGPFDLAYRESFEDAIIDLLTNCIKSRKISLVYNRLKR